MAGESGDGTCGDSWCDLSCCGEYTSLERCWKEGGSRVRGGRVGTVSKGVEAAEEEEGVGLSADWGLLGTRGATVGLEKETPLVKYRLHEGVACLHKITMTHYIVAN